MSNSNEQDRIAALRAYFAEHDPDVLAAVADVDRSLIRSMLELTPMERLQLSYSRAMELSAIREGLQKECL